MARLTELAHGGGCGCKIAPDSLQALLETLTKPRREEERLLVSHATRDDAAVYRINDTQALVATTDFFTPVVDDPYDFGFIAATNALSDVYAMGGKPLFALSILAMPTEKIDERTIASILQGGQDACEENGMTVAGGHSIDSSEPIYGLAVTGEVSIECVRTNALARSGDVVILGKPLGVGILSAALRKGSLEDDAYLTMRRHTMKPNSIGFELASEGLVNAMTDVTGFGLLGHLGEICAASSCGAEIGIDSVPFIPEAARLAQNGIGTGASARNLRSVKSDTDGLASLSDWQRTLLSDPQTSGGLLMTCSPDKAGTVLDRFHRQGYAEAGIIGKVVEGQPTMRIDKGHVRTVRT